MQQKERRKWKGKKGGQEEMKRKAEFLQSAGRVRDGCT